MKAKKLPTSLEFEAAIAELYKDALVFLDDLEELQDLKERFSLYWASEPQMSWRECIDRCQDSPLFLHTDETTDIKNRQDED